MKCKPGQHTLGGIPAGTSVPTDHVSPISKSDTPVTVVENLRVKILGDFKSQTDMQLLAQQPDIVVAEKELKRAVVIDREATRAVTMTDVESDVSAYRYTGFVRRIFIFFYVL